MVSRKGRARGTKKGGPTLARNELDIIKGHYRKNIIVYVALRGFVVIISVPHWNSIVFLNQKYQVGIEQYVFLLG